MARESIIPNYPAIVVPQSYNTGPKLKRLLPKAYKKESIGFGTDAAYFLMVNAKEFHMEAGMPVKTIKQPQ
jgi:hypothetical protein